MKMQLHNNELSTSCTWGEGPDVILHIKRSKLHVNTWGANFVPLDLTSEEAIRLGEHLIMSGKRAIELDNLCKEHDDFMENNNE